MVDDTIKIYGSPQSTDPLEHLREATQAPEASNWIQNILSFFRPVVLSMVGFVKLEVIGPSVHAVMF